MRGGGDKRPLVAKRGTPPPMQRGPPKQGTTPPPTYTLPPRLHSAMGSAMPFRSSLKNPPFGGFLGGVCFLLYFFHLLFLGGLFLPLSLRRSSAMQPLPRCGAATRGHSLVLPLRPPSSPFCNSTIDRTKLLACFFSQSKGLQHCSLPSATFGPVRLCLRSLQGGTRPLSQSPARLR